MLFSLPRHLSPLRVKNFLNKINKILCHHYKEGRSRCIRIKLFNKEIYICSRCLGLYPFTILWLILMIIYDVRLSYRLDKNLIHFLFLPAFLDWTFTSLGIIKSSNMIRFFTGFTASFALSRWAFLFIMKYNMDIVLKNALIYSIGIIIILLISYRKKQW